MGVKLYDYQREMKASVLEALGRCDAVMCQMPTGTGKTHVLASAVREFAGGGHRSVWVVAHRRELVEQIRRTWDSFCEGGGSAPDVKAFSIQWLSRNWDKVGDGNPCLIVIDEAHHALADTYRELWRRYPEAKKLGMTATPCRLSGEGFAGLFDTLLVSKSIPEFVMTGRLSLFDYYSVPYDSKIRREIAMMKRRGADGDYQVREMERTLNTPRHIEYLYNSLRRYAGGRRGIVYAINVDHARAIAGFYAEKGLNSCVIDCKTPAGERDAEVEAFRRGEIDVMVNVNIFSEGFDCPEVEFIQLARPTLSLAVYLQQVGRGLRKARGKRKCTILDNVGLCRTFGTPIREWDWEGMFRGTAGSPRIDAGDRRMLVRHLGYPGRLADEPMEKLISHDGMDEAVRRQDYLVYRGDSDAVGIRIGGRIVADVRLERVIEVADDHVAVQLRDRSKMLITPNGIQERLPSDFIGFDVLDANIVRVKTERRTYYKDLISGFEFGDEPRPVRYGPFDMIEGDGMVRPRRPEFRNEYLSRYVSEDCWRGFYFRGIEEVAVAKNVYGAHAVDRGAWEPCLVDTVMLPDTSMMLYFIEELPNRSIIVASIFGEYFLVKPDLTRKLLFTGATYKESRDKLTLWMARHNTGAKPQA